MTKPDSPAYLRVKQIVAPSGLLPIGKSTFWNNVKRGIYPQPVRLSPRVTAWRRVDIEELMDRINRGEL